MASKAANLLPGLILDFFRQNQPESATEKAWARASSGILVKSVESPPMLFRKASEL